MATTSRWDLPYPVGSDAADVPLWMQDLAVALDDVAMDDQGVAASRPDPDIGQWYKSTDTGALERGNGTTFDQVPIVGAGQVGATSLASNAVTTAKITDANVTTAKIADEAVTGAKVADDIVGSYRTLHEAAGMLDSSNNVGAGVYLFIPTVLRLAGAATGSGFAHIIDLRSADYDISGRTTKLRVRSTILVNGTAPAVNFTVGLYPAVTPGGSTNTVTLTAGTVVSGSTIAFSTPAANSMSLDQKSADFDLPQGIFVLAVAVSGSQAAGAAVNVSAQLQIHHV